MTAYSTGKGEELTYDYQYVQIRADQDCYYGTIEYRQKLRFKPNKLNFSSSDAALQFVLQEIASPSVKALLNGKDELPNRRSETGSSSRFVPCKKKTSSQNYIGEAVRVWCAGIGYIFGSISPVLKSALGYNQRQITRLEIAKGLGNCISFFAGSLCIILPASLVYHAHWSSQEFHWIYLGLAHRDTKITCSACLGDVRSDLCWHQWRDLLQHSFTGLFASII